MTANDDAARLRTRLRWRTMADSVGEDALRVAVLASYTVDPMVPYLGTALADAGLPARIEVAPFNQIERQCLDRESEVARFAPDVVVVAARFEELWAGRAYPGVGPVDGFATDLRYLADAAVDAAGRWGAELVFVLPAVPEVRPAGVGDDGNPAGVVAAATHAREDLRSRLACRERVAVVDAEAVVRAVGTIRAYRPALLATARIPFAEECFDLLAQRVSRVVRTRRGPVGHPVVVVDDAALTSATGSTADDRARDEDPALWLPAHLVEMARTGTAVAVCGGAAEPRTPVRIAAWRGGAADVSAQIAEIVGELGARPDRVTFVTPDDERASAVRRDLPAIAVLALTGEPEQWARQVDASAAGDRPPPAAPRPGAVRSGPLTLDTFLATLRLEVGVTPLPVDAADHAAELLSRVAEFHLDGARRAAAWFGSGVDGRECREITVRDRFGDHGRAGVICWRAEGDVLAVEAWALTCPVLGKGVEDRVLAALANRARELDCRVVRFHYRPTARNGVFHRFLCGLTADVPDREAPGEVDVPVAELSARAAAPTRVPAGGPVARRVVRRGARARIGARAGGLTSAAQILRAIEGAAEDGAQSAGDEVVAGPTTETQRRLATVFAEVLRRPVTDVHRSFFDNGGDSMLAVRMIAKANRAGLRLTLQQVVKHQSVAALAEVATETGRGADAVDVRSAPLLPGQAWFFGLDLPRPDHFNQSLRFELAEPADVRCLESAVAALVAHHQSLRMTFRATSTGWRQVDPGPPPRPPFVHVDLSDRSRAEQDAELARHHDERQHEMSIADGRLLHVALFGLGPDRPDQLLVLFHHLAIDGLSWRLVLADLQDAYDRIRGTGRADLDTGSTPVLAWARRLNDYAQTDEVRAELPRWLDESRTEHEPVPPDVAVPAPATAFTHSRVVLLDETDTAALSERAVTVDRVSADVLVLTAVSRALCDRFDRDRMLFDVVNHGREPFVDGVDVSRTVGWLNMNVPVLVDVDLGAPLADAVAATDRQLRFWSGPHGAGDNLLRYLSADADVRGRLAALPRADVLFSYAGTFEPGGAGPALFGSVVDDGGGDMDEGAATSYALQFNAIVVDGRLRVDTFYHGARFHEETIAALQEHCVSVLRDLVANAKVPSITGRRS